MVAQAEPRRVPSTPREIKTRLQQDRLEAALRKSNTTVYQRTIERHARALGVTGKVPRIADGAVLASIRDRARTSAESIVGTQQKRRAALIDEHGGKLAARPAYNEWHAGQQERIAAFEAGQTAHQASEDFVAKNGLEGVEHLEPGDAAVPDACQDAIDAGEVPIGELGSFPIHLNCPHFVVRAFNEDSIPPLENLWLGQDRGEVDAQ